MPCNFVTELHLFLDVRCSFPPRLVPGRLVRPGQAAAPQSQPGQFLQDLSDLAELLPPVLAYSFPVRLVHEDAPNFLWPGEDQLRFSS